MDQTNAFRNLNFDVRPRRIPARLITVIAALVIFTILWWIIPPEGLYWLLALSLAVVVWMATYGWRPAISNLVRFLQTIEKL